MDLYQNEKEELEEDFDTIYNKIKEECIAFEHNMAEKYRKEFGFFQCAFIVEGMGESTMYSQPYDLMYDMYYSLGQELDANSRIRNQAKVPKDEYIEKCFNEKEYIALKKYYEKSELSFFTHCSLGPLQKTLFFELNEDTKQWLVDHSEDGFVVGKLQDLAVYRNGELVYSSCTHEKEQTFF